MSGVPRATPPKTAVVLFQLGGPDSLEAVEPFLVNLFSDPDIIDFPFARLAREPLARLVARQRAAKARKHYAEIGGRSPILALTQRQAAALEEELAATLPARAYVAMRYWHPLTEEVVAEVIRQSFAQVVLLPLYPQYSGVTSGSSLKEWQRRFPANSCSTAEIRQFYEHPLYLEAVAERINQALGRFPAGADVHLLFSAHGVPQSVIDAGDPYQEQTEATVRLLRQRAGWPNRATLCYQSKVGPGRWLTPMLHQALPELRARGVKHVLVIPISFVTDHVETLYEIDIEAREQAKKLGFDQFEMMAALNDSPLFIRCLADLVLRAVEARVESPASVS
ncbi:MAG: ferrochelatase [Candidatus Acidiferrales bacterium]